MELKIVGNNLNEALGNEMTPEATFMRAECQNILRWDFGKASLQTKGDRNDVR
jgi:hypothetical protein